MDTKEAAAVLAEHLARYRPESYADLAEWVRERRVDTPEMTAPSGTRYFMEFEFFWDNKADRDVRVIGSISDGCGIRAFVPLTDSFILSPEGSFIGE